MLKHIRRLMRLIYAIFILLLALIASAQCQQTPEEWLNKGMALYGQSRYEEAIKAYDEAITLDPNDTNAWYNKGNVLDDLGRYDEAIKAYNEAIRLDPSDATAKSKKGNALFSQGKYDEAIKCYDEAIRLDPNDFTTWYNKGNALRRLHRNSEADAAFVKAESLKVTNHGIMSSSGHGSNVANRERKNEIAYAPKESHMMDFAPTEPHVRDEAIAKQNKIDDVFANPTRIEDVIGYNSTLETARGTSDTTGKTQPQIVQLQKTIDDIWQDLPSGWILYNPSTEMQVGKEELVEVRIARNITDDLSKGLLGTGEPKLEKINKTGTQMRAELQGDSFTIAPLFTADAAEQPIVGDYAQWEWKVIPLVDGNQTLRLCVDAIIEIPGYNDRSTPVRVFEKVIRVKINPIYTIGTFLENNWQWIITTILSTGILSLLWRNFRKKDKNS